MFRRHLAAVVTFPLGIVALVLLSMPLASALKSHTGIMIFHALYAPAAIGCVLIAQTLALYRRTEPRRKVEWSVLAPVLVASALIAGHWNHIARLWVSGPLGSSVGMRWITVIVLSIAFLTGICFLGAALAARWMAHDGMGGSPKRLSHEVIAVGILTVVVQGFFKGAQELAWRIQPASGPNLEAILQRDAMARAGTLVGLLAAWFVLALLFGKRADRQSRWRLLALWSVWVSFDLWLRELRFALPRIRPDEWTWAVLIGAGSGAIAIQYTRLMVKGLWARAFTKVGARKEENPPGPESPPA